ncbi:unnamed protein product [Blepharisma stoltei]|uniref:Uncharacterized protein n=1 Tax=Blepharisma stoltei TaxID=1481888 RepID=A0AAU9IMY9_9CILI|nr:unnamed protein product [Blepharisma stoltei]
MSMRIAALIILFSALFFSPNRFLLRRIIFQHSSTLSKNSQNNSSYFGAKTPLDPQKIIWREFKYLIRSWQSRNGYDYLQRALKKSGKIRFFWN